MLKSFAGYALVAVIAIGAGVAVAQSEADAPAYLDDRSTPEQLVLSYFNAINRYEYARAYGYFGVEEAPGFDTWQFHFDDVVRAEISFGQMAQEGAAGSIYYQLPVTVDYEHAEGQHHVERGCIAIRWVNPANQQRPPFTPMYILSADLQAENETRGFAPAKCDSAPAADVGSPAYLDDRSTAEQLVRSFFNAVERGEYGRAVTYFSEAAAPKDITAWARASEVISGVELTFGMPSHYATAGSISFGIPVTVEYASSSESWIEFGCIAAHWDLPNDDEPFAPMRITNMDLKRQVASDAIAPPICD